MISELRNTDQGCYLVTTATGSHYRIDLDSRMLTRHVGATPPTDEYWKVGTSHLRRDGESLEVLMVDSCKVGEPGRLFLQVRADKIPTLRITSPVVSIQKLEFSE